MLILFGYSEYMNNITSNDTTETLSREDISLSGDNFTCHLTTCAKLVTEKLRGVVCIDHPINPMVRIHYHLTHNHIHMS